MALFSFRKVREIKVVEVIFDKRITWRKKAKIKKKDFFLSSKKFFNSSTKLKAFIAHKKYMKIEQSDRDKVKV